MSNTLRILSSTDLRDAACRRISAAHHGVITREQAYAAGHQRWSLARLLADGIWREVAPNVFAVAGAPATLEQQCESAVAWAGPGAALCRNTAAWAWGLRPPLARAQVALTRSTRTGAFDVFQVDSLDGDIRRVRNWPVTSVERTLRDLSPNLEEDALDNLLWDSFRLHLTTPERIEAYVRKHAGQGNRGVKILREALYRGRLPARSVLEARMSRLMADAGLPRPLSLLQVFSNGRFIHEIDFAYPEVALAIEVDGFRWHGHRIAFIKDRLRANELTLLGWRILRFTWQQLRRKSAHVVGQIREALGDTRNIHFLFEDLPARDHRRWLHAGPPDLQRPLFGITP